MKIIQEASVYDDEKLVDDVEDASKVATNFLTEITSDGVFVHEEGVTDPTASGANGVHISDTVKIIRDGDAVAQYGEAAIIGKEDDSHVVVDYHSFQMIYGSETEPYVHFSDLRGTDGLAEVTDELEATSDAYLTVELRCQAESIVSVKIDDIATSSYTFNTVLNAVVFSVLITAGSIITITYKTPEEIRAYTFGSRESGEIIGAHSFVAGLDAVGGGYGSSAFNRGLALGAWAHASNKATALGTWSHAEGYETEANATFSHAQNEGTIASRIAQTAIGKYNAEDTYNVRDSRGMYALIIGNGADENNRSNAMTVDWDGNIKSSGFAVPCVFKYTWSNQTCTASTRSTISGLTVTGLPSGATILGVVITITPNNHWVRAYASATSDNTISINYSNESSSDVSGAFTALIFFTL